MTFLEFKDEGTVVEADVAKMLASYSSNVNSKIGKAMNAARKGNMKVAKAELDAARNLLSVAAKHIH